MATLMISTAILRNVTTHFILKIKSLNTVKKYVGLEIKSDSYAVNFTLTYRANSVV